MLIQRNTYRKPQYRCQDLHILVASSRTLKWSCLKNGIFLLEETATFCNCFPVCGGTRSWTSEHFHRTRSLGRVSNLEVPEWKVVTLSIETKHFNTELSTCQGWKGPQGAHLIHLPCTEAGLSRIRASLADSEWNVWFRVSCLCQKHHVHEMRRLHG